MPLPELPSELLLAISDSSGGKVALVVGAGCSKESPTELPLARELAERIHGSLVAHGVIPPDSCSDSSDLSVLADTVHDERGSQRPLVDRFPPEEFRHASPNRGHLLAAALLREHAFSDVLTLNFDLALSTSLPQVAGRDHVGEITGPDDHRNLRSHNLIYLHRNITYDPEALILTTTALADAWSETRWETRVASRVVVAPVVVFVGLGSKSEVLIESVKRIAKAVGDQQRILFVDPQDPEDSAFFEALDLDEAQHIKAGWGDFMEALSGQVCEAYHEELVQAVGELFDHEEDWEEQDPGVLAALLTDLGLLRLGRVRARWALSSRPYLTRNEVRAAHIADLLIAIGIILERADCQPHFDDEGNVEFRRQDDGVPLGVLGFASGEGIHRWHALDTEIRHRRRYTATIREPSIVVVSGVNGGRAAEPSPPSELAGTGNEEKDRQDLITGPSAYRLVTVDEIHESGSDLAGVFE